MICGWTGLSNQTIEDLLVNSQGPGWIQAKGCYEAADATRSACWFSMDKDDDNTRTLLANDIIHGLAMDKQGRCG